ncbi:ABC-2 type transport system permease protein [Sedimentibacter acidaminivorans]|uniref:ABC-2 type transport system permease protein n=1 Tax=Sedimentibacter acidaminivorans TaxID=913099 RepID=A0ABS4GGV8_9FIRM|nr:ABC transporter permease [Sedimentibacter acidaminivorans]MBP1926932.1 ABC-2 type transport system permease protein [Sedimentibacter acidaminivorans]
MFIKSIKEECVIFLTNKMNLLILFVLPILCVILLGVELSKGVITDIPIAVINYDNSNFSRQLVETFDKNETFNVTYYLDNEQELEKLMKNSKARMGLIIPKNFYNDIAALKSPTLSMIYDGSNMSITSTAKAKATEILLTYKAGATIQQLTTRLGISYKQAYNITQAFQFNNRMLYNPSKSFKDFLAPVLLAGYIQAALALVATISINQNIFKVDETKRLGYATGKVLFYTLCGSLSYIICIILQVSLFQVPFRGSLLSVLVLSIGLCFSVSAFCILISTLIKNRIIALTAGAIVFIPNSITAGTTWPLISMPSGYQSFAKYIPFTHYANNIRAVYLKGISVQQLTNDVLYLFIFGIIVLILTEVVMVIAEKEIDDKELMDDDFHRDLQKGIPLDI